MLAKTVKALGRIARESLLYRMGGNASDSRGCKHLPAIGNFPKHWFSAGAKERKRACPSIHYDTAPGAFQGHRIRRLGHLESPRDRLFLDGETARDLREIACWGVKDMDRPVSADLKLQ